MNRPTAQICYLCGEGIQKGTSSQDHVPPAQIYPSQYRASGAIRNPLTLPAHVKCNMRYQRDEDYFVHSLAPLVHDSPAGKVFWRDYARRIRRPENQGLTEKVRREFREATQGGILAPPGKIFKEYDGKRIRRVIWKITRGLFFKEYERFLPEGTLRRIVLIDPDTAPPPEFAHVRDTPERGPFPAFFDYKYISVKELDGFHYWAFLFWDKLIVTCAFHDPLCPCEICHGTNQ